VREGEEENKEEEEKVKEEEMMMMMMMMMLTMMMTTMMMTTTTIILGIKIITLGLVAPIYLPIKCNSNWNCAADQQHKVPEGTNFL